VTDDHSKGSELTKVRVTRRFSYWFSLSAGRKITGLRGQKGNKLSAHNKNSRRGEKSLQETEDQLYSARGNTRQIHDQRGRRDRYGVNRIRKEKNIVNENGKKEEVGRNSNYQKKD